ncbi:MAG: hypothetical protein IT566_10175 [Rhodospirillaceae bacterium]|nr:hypothetical protein [Rhodospirillaceae bacterium]
MSKKNIVIRWHDEPVFWEFIPLSWFEEPGTARNLVYPVKSISGREGEAQCDVKVGGRDATLTFVSNLRNKENKNLYGTLSIKFADDKRRSVTHVGWRTDGKVHEEGGDVLITSLLDPRKIRFPNEFFPLSDETDIAAAASSWRKIVRTGATPGRTRDTWVHLDVWAKIPEQVHHGKWHANVGIDPRSRVVTINIPATRFTQNVLGAFARNKTGELWLLRQGHLQSQGAGKRAIRAEEFAALSGLRSVSVRGAGRRYYPVARLDREPATALRSLADFTAICAAVRRRVYGPSKTAKKHAARVKKTIIKLLDAHEKSSGKRHISAQEARELETFHKPIQNALCEAIKNEGAVPIRPGKGGLKVDVFVPGKPKNALIEIKTAARAADIHTGVGQLLIYGKIFRRLGASAPILVLPDMPDADLVAAIKSFGIAIYTYGDVRRPQFPADLLKFCTNCAAGGV